MREPSIDVRCHNFTRVFRGFDQAEVEAVLQAAAVDFDEARATLRQLEDALAEARAEAEPLLQGERSVIRAMRSADEHARMCVGSAHRQAARVVESAEEHARTLLAMVEAERTALIDEIRTIEQRRAHVLSELGGLIDSISTAPVSSVVPTHEPRPGRTRATDAAPDDGRAVADAMVACASSASNSGSEDGVTVSVSAGGPAVGALPRELPPPDAIDGGDDGHTDTKAIDEGGTAPVRRLFTMSTRRAAMAAAALVLCAAAIAWPSAHGTRTPGTAAPVPEPESIAVHAAEADAPVTAAAAVAAEPVAPLVIALGSSRPCWVRVTVDGVPEELMLGAGEQIARTAKAAIRLRIGDAAALSVEVNGHALPPLGRTGQVVDRTFTADALLQ